MENETSFQRRQRAPMHFCARADNARAASLYLSEGMKEHPALAEAYHREAALALELIIKAVIAQRIENGSDKSGLSRPPISHDVVSLWKTARLPVLDRGDHGRLIDVKHVLQWAGRYATPTKESDYDREAEEKKPYRQILQKFGKLELQQRWSFDFEDFDRIYQIAADVFWSIAPYIDDDGYLILPEGRESYRG